MPFIRLKKFSFTLNLLRVWSFFFFFKSEMGIGFCPYVCSISSEMIKVFYFKFLW